MLNLYRRHIRKCPHDGRDSLRCQCPIWIDWVLPDGERFQKSLGLKDWQAAQRRARDMESEGITNAGEAITVQKAIDDFTKDATNTIKASTVEQYTRLLKRLSAYCKENGLLFLKQLTVVEVRNFRNSWTTYSPRTAGKHIEKLKRFFNWCGENGWVALNPAKPLRAPKVGDTDVVPFSEEEIGKILKAADAYTGRNREKLKVLIDLMLITGLSISDAVTLSKSRVSQQSSGWVLELRRTKTGVAVRCPIPDDLAARFMKLDRDTPFWTGTSDTEDATKNFQKIFKRVFRRAGVKGTPHQLRHTTVKRLLVKGVPIGHIASLLGHSEQVCRKHYSKWIGDRQTALDNVIRATWTA
jgi:site-specific recombinase XerD